VSKKIIATAKTPLRYMSNTYKVLRMPSAAVVPAAMKKSASGTQPKIR
jgi:hypothetical protein